MTITKLYIILLILTFYSVLGDTDTTSIIDVSRFGNFFSGGENNHHADFRDLPGIPNCCPKFTSGNGFSADFGVFIEFQMPYGLATGLRLGYAGLGADLSANESTPIRIDEAMGTGVLNHVIEANIGDIFVEPYLGYWLNEHIKFKIGGHIGFVVNSKFHNYERLIEPADRGVFVDTKTRTRNDTSGTIPAFKSVISGLWGSAGYNLFMNESKTLIFTPYIYYFQGLSDLLENRTWTLSSLRAGLEISFSIPESKDTIPVEIQEEIYNDTIKVISENIESSYYIKGETSFREWTEEKLNKKTVYHRFFRTDTLFVKGAPKPSIELDVPVLYLQGQFVSQAFPMLPNIFFDRDKSHINEFYDKVQDISNYSTEKLEINPVVYARNALNIIGERLKESPSANIILYGFADSVTENSDCSLAKSRASSVREYLKTVWSIDESRISISDEKCTPFDPTLSKSDSGFADNRRVEISSDNPEILKPIIKNRYLEPKAISPPEINVITNTKDLKGIRSWELKAYKGNKLISSHSSGEIPDSIPIKVPVNNFMDLFDNEPMKFILDVVDNEGNSATAEKTLKVIADTVDVELQRLSLILFGISSEKLSQRARNDIDNFLKDISDKSTASIKGYTDALGLSTSNLILSENRAKNTLDYIKKISPNLQINNCEGVASLEYPPGIKSYTSPAERFLSRTVFIELLRKIK